MKNNWLYTFVLGSTLIIAACAAQQAEIPAFQAFTSNWQCESGAAITASYPDTDTAIVTYKGKVYNLKIAVSASGARYVGEEIEWWTKGSGPGATGSLFRHNPDGTSGDTLELCTCE